MARDVIGSILDWGALYHDSKAAPIREMLKARVGRPNRQCGSRMVAPEPLQRWLRGWQDPRPVA